MSTQVRYHKSTENIDDAERATVKPLGVSYGRFTVLERVLIVAVSVFVVLTILFVILYAANKSSGSSVNDDEECGTEKSTVDPSSAQAKLITNSLDWSVDPCDDFYIFACNKWLSANHLSPGQKRIDRFEEAAKLIYDFIQRKLQDKETLKKYENISAVSKALNDYSACMTYINVSEEKKAEQALKLITEYGGWNISTPGWSSNSWELMTNLVKIRRNLGIHPLVFVDVGVDSKNSSRHRIKIIQVGDYKRLRDMYLSDKAVFSKRRKNYKDLMFTVMTTLAKTSKNNSVVRKQMNEVFQLEKFLAEISLSREEVRNKRPSFHLVSIKNLQEQKGNRFSWLGYFQKLFKDTGVVITSETKVNVHSLDYVKNLTRILDTIDNAVLANYMIWEVIWNTYKYFPRVVSEEFTNFLSTAGRKTNKARNKICYGRVRDLFGVPLSMLIMDDLGSDNFKQVEDMAEIIKNVHINDMETLSWMDADTKKTAVKKAKTMKQHIAFAKILFDHDKLNKKYAGLEIDDDDHFGNYLRKQKFKIGLRLRTLSQPVDKDRVLMDDFFSQAYYSNTVNKIGVPTGLLQPPFFDKSRPMSLNYGGVGMIIGHETTHSVDVDGRKYDENGNLFNWWTNSSLMEFQKRIACLAKKYSKYSFQGSEMDGESFLDETIADNGGIKLAFQAYQRWNKEHDEPDLPLLNLTRNQLFFVGSAQIWCSKYLPSPSKPWTGHPPGMIRVIGMLSNYPEFSKAFKCPIGSRMNATAKCVVW